MYKAQSWKMTKNTNFGATDLKRAFKSIEMVKISEGDVIKIGELGLSPREFLHFKIMQKRSGQGE